MLNRLVSLVVSANIRWFAQRLVSKVACLDLESKPMTEKKIEKLLVSACLRSAGLSRD